jgi:hypothetical protein
MTRGRLVIVGGHSRGVGKTLLVEQWLRAHAHTRWVAVKVSAHRHAPDSVAVPRIEEWHDVEPTTQTGRYLLAGAARAFLLRAPEMALPQAASFIESLRDDGAHVIVESNRLVRYLKPQLLLFVVDPRIDDWKASSADCLRVPNVVLCWHQGGLRHDRDFNRFAVGDGAAFRADSLHRLALSRAVAHGAAATRDPGKAPRNRP